MRDLVSCTVLHAAKILVAPDHGRRDGRGRVRPVWVRSVSVSCGPVAEPGHGGGVDAFALRQVLLVRLSRESPRHTEQRPHFLPFRHSGCTHWRAFGLSPEHV